MAEEQTTPEQDPVEAADTEVQRLIAEVEAQVEEPEDTDDKGEEPEKDEADEPKFELTAAMKREILAMPASERAQYIEDLAKSSGLEVKLPGESKDEQAVAQEAGKKAALNVSTSKMVEELAASGYDFPEMHDPESEGAYSTIALTYMDMKSDQKVQAIEQQRQAQVEEQQAVQKFEEWKASTAPDIAEHFGNRDAGPAVLGYLNDPARITLDEIGMYFATNEDGTPKYPAHQRRVDNEIKQLVTEFAQAQEPDVKIPKAEPIGGRAKDSEPEVGDVERGFLEQMKNDPDFKETAGAFSKKIGARR